MDWFKTNWPRIRIALQGLGLGGLVLVGDWFEPISRLVYLINLTN